MKENNQSEKSVFSEFFVTDNSSSSFFPRPSKRVKLKIKNVIKDLSFEGDSEILYDE